MSFGFSVGDFIAVIELANKVRKEFVNAPDQFKAISDEYDVFAVVSPQYAHFKASENVKDFAACIPWAVSPWKGETLMTSGLSRRSVRSLSIVLQDVDVALSQRELQNEQRLILNEIASGCKNVLSDLEKQLDKFLELGPEDGTVSKRIKRVWKRLQWEPEDIKELRCRINSNVTLLNAFLGRITQVHVVTLVRHQEDQETQKILEWLTPIDYAAQQNDYINQRQAGTGRQLLDSPQFQDWLATKQQTLFCPGIPGAGKTIVTSIVVDELMTKFIDDPSVGVAYVYCNFRRQDEQKPEKILSSIMRQLSKKQASIPHTVQLLYDEYTRKGISPTIEALIDTLSSLIASFSRVFIVVDALDECQTTNGYRTVLISKLLWLQTHLRVNLFATSRNIPEISQRFKNCIEWEILAANEDVLRYLDGHMFQLPKFVTSESNLELQKEISIAILQAVHGMFLLAQLHLESLVGKRSPKAIRKALKTLPTGSNAYDLAYHDAMSRIEGQLRDQEELAKQVLSWITCAKRPLTWKELQQALAVELGDADIDEDNFVASEDMVSVCAGLVRIEEESNIIRLVHYTTQDYLERTQNQWFPTSQDDIAMVCLTYVSFDVFESGHCDNEDDYRRLVSHYPLFHYAAQHWVHHAVKASPSNHQLKKMIIDFLKSRTRLDIAIQATKIDFIRDSYFLHTSFIAQGFIGLHFAAHYGLDDAMDTLLQNGPYTDSRDNWHRTPLMYAARSGHESTVKLLLAHQAVVADSMDLEGSTALHFAASRGHARIVELLLARDDVDATMNDGTRSSPLLVAAECGHGAVVRLLLARTEVDPNAYNQYGDTPLARAALFGSTEVVELLLTRSDIDVNRADISSGTPLTHAATDFCGGSESIVKLLLAHENIDVNKRDGHGVTGLYMAAQNNFPGIVKLFLARSDVDVDLPARWGETPLAAAMECGHDVVVALLVEKGAKRHGKRDRENRYGNETK